MIKKIIALLTTAILLLYSIPFYASAEEEKHLTREEHLALACEVFPEYAELIRNKDPLIPISPRSVEPEIIFSETREVSETHTMTLFEYSDGDVMIASSEVHDSVIVESISGSGVALYVVDLLVTIENSTQQFFVDNVRFTINYNEYDFITSAGNWNTSTTTEAGGEIIYARQLSTETLARIQYSAEFRMNDGSLPKTPGIDFYVGNNTYYFDVN